MSFQPHFVAKTERVDAPVPRSFRVLSLREFVGDLEEGSLFCPVRAVNIYLRRTSSVVVRASSLFVFPRSSSPPISKNAVSYFLREVIVNIVLVSCHGCFPWLPPSVLRQPSCLGGSHLVPYVWMIGGSRLQLSTSR